MSVNGTTTASGRKGSFFTSEETETIELGDGFWVEVKTELDYGEENELEGAAIRAQIGMGGATASPTLEYSIRNQRALMLALYITDWNLTDGRGKPVSLPDSLPRRQLVVERLRTRWARTIVARIEQLRIRANAVDVVSLTDVEDAAADPTVPGVASESATPSSSDAGSEASPTEISSVRPTASSGKRSK